MAHPVGGSSRSQAKTPQGSLPVPLCPGLGLCSLQLEVHRSEPQCLRLVNRSNQIFIFGNRILSALADLL